MRILFTPAGSNLVQAIASELAGQHQVTVTDRGDVDTSLDFVRSDLGHGPETASLVREVDALVLTGNESDPPDGEDPRPLLDYHTRGIYNLLWAAREAGVSRAVYLSTLELLDAYDADLTVTERWRPRPNTDTRLLKHHLSEYVCKEFAREGKLNLVCLRLGDFGRENPPNRPDAGYSSALSMSDAVQAVDKALNLSTLELLDAYDADLTVTERTSLTGWNVFHIQSAMATQRYTTSTAEKALGFQPGQRD